MSHQSDTDPQHAMPCEEAEGLLDTWLDPTCELDEDEAFFLEVHLEGCASCHERLETTLDAMPEPPRSTALPVPTQAQAEAVFGGPPTDVGSVVTLLDSVAMLAAPEARTLGTLLHGLRSDSKMLGQVLDSCQLDAAPAHLKRVQALIHQMESALEQVPVAVGGISERARHIQPEPHVLPTLAPDLEGAQSAMATLEAAVDWPVSTRYSLVHKIGRGASATVWRATDCVLDRPVALKVLHLDMQPGIQFERFCFEARVTARMSHPGIVPVHDAGQLADGRLFYVMRQIGERTLRDVLVALSRKEQAAIEAFPLPRLLHIFSQLCLTMAYAHDHGFIHRDLKPENILLGDYGEVYVADWGLTRATGAALPEPSQRPGPETAHGAVLGTPSYMAPEQLVGEVETLTSAADVYSLGVMLFELLTLERPWSPTNPVQLYLAIMSSELPDPRSLTPERDIPESISSLCRRAMAQEASARPATRFMAERITDVLDGVKEQRRRAEQAQKALEHARSLWTGLRQTHRALALERRAIDALQSTPDPAASLEDRRLLWRRQQDLDEMALEAERLFTETVQTAKRSLEHRETQAAHELLADLYWLKVEETLRLGDIAGQLFFRSLCREHDTGRHQDQLAETGELDIQVRAPASLVRIERQVPMGPLLDPREMPIRKGLNTLPVGSYIVDLHAPGRMPARVPVVVSGHQRSVVDLLPPPTFPGCEAFVFVSGAEVALGGDPEAPRSLPPSRVHVEPFLMARLPVTLAQYCDFLNELARDDPKAARQHAPRSPDGNTIWLDHDPDNHTFSVYETDPDGDRWDPRWPVHMLNWHDANAYCRWRSEKEGVTYRLPTEYEWELAARGVDRRLFPWGNGFDPALCRMTDSTPGRPLPATVGSYPLDRSPYHVQDMAGQVFEWTSTQDEGDPTRYIMRGGSYGSPSASCRVASRWPQFAGQNSTPFGFRVVRAIPDEVTR